MGWDDNGLPTERRVQNYYGVRCDPSSRTDPDFVRRRRPRPAPAGVTAELRGAVPPADGRGREGVRGRLAPPGAVGRLELTYATIDERGRRASQRAFLRLLSAATPTGPRPPPCGTSTSGTAVAQAELIDRRTTGRLPPAPFPRPDGRHRRDRDHPPRAAAGLRGPGGPPRRPALPRPVRHHRHHARCSACRCRSWPTRWPTPRRARASP